jgi:hypothetical protein
MAAMLIMSSRFFPSTEPEPESVGGESAENGPIPKDAEAKDTEELDKPLEEE